MIGISNETALILLEQRLDIALENWGNPDDKDLYMKMYEDYIDSGCFCGCEDFDAMEIVDNDIVNYTSVIYEDDEDFEKYYKLAKKGERNISCKHLGWNFIEQYDDTRILVRY